MKVKDNRTQKSVPFSELKAGEVFLACGDPCIKTVSGNAVCLTDGNWVTRQPTDWVEPIKAEVVLG